MAELHSSDFVTTDAYETRCRRLVLGLNFYDSGTSTTAHAFSGRSLRSYIALTIDHERSAVIVLASNTSPIIAIPVYEPIIIA
jgi:hypothetical protein